jgi:hypothetical protein
MEPEVSVLCPHDLATGLCPEPDESSLRPPILFIEIQFNTVARRDEGAPDTLKFCLQPSGNEQR